jgi:hypothetical protein
MFRKPIYLYHIKRAHFAGHRLSHNSILHISKYRSMNNVIAPESRFSARGKNVLDSGAFLVTAGIVAGSEGGAELLLQPLRFVAKLQSVNFVRQYEQTTGLFNAIIERIFKIGKEDRHEADASDWVVRLGEVHRRYAFSFGIVIWPTLQLRAVSRGSRRHGCGVSFRTSAPISLTVIAASRLHQSTL